MPSSSMHVGLLCKTCQAVLSMPSLHRFHKQDLRQHASPKHQGWISGPPARHGNRCSLQHPAADILTLNCPDLHVSPWTAPSKGAKLCSYHHWFGRPSSLRFEPYYELPMGVSQLRALVQFRLGSHALPIEQGRFARPAHPAPPSPVHRLRYTVCGRWAPLCV